MFASCVVYASSLLARLDFPYDIRMRGTFSLISILVIRQKVGQYFTLAVSVDPGY